MSMGSYMINIKKDRDICRVFFIYWIVLLIWQNAFAAIDNTAVDSALKFVLLGYLAFSYLRNGRTVRRRNIILFLVFSISLLITYLSCDINNTSLGNVVYYLYPVISLFLMHCIGSECTVSRNQVEKMNNYILLVLVISVLYTVIFHPNQYINAIGAQGSGYGNELCSFFASMHEYALYLFYGIAICINRVADRERLRATYVILFIVFMFTMILTFSRTAVAACVVYISIYAFMNRREKIGKLMIAFLLLGFVLIMLQSSLYDYLFKIVWKSGLTNSRDALTQQAISYFLTGDLWSKLYGHGASGTRLFFKDSLGYASVHNGYLQVLLYFGIFGLLFMVGYLLQSFRECIRFFRVNREVALQSLVMLIFCALVMYPQTFIIFSSSIDCFFLTAMFLVVPKYQRNAVLYGNYEQ